MRTLSIGRSDRASWILVALSIVLASGCTRSASDGAREDLGVVTLALALPSGIAINAVHYKIHSAAAVSPPADADGDINLSNPSAQPSVERNYPASTLDTVTLSATTSSGESCTGVSPAFSVLSGQQTLVSVTLTCGLLAADGGSGSVRINSTVLDQTDICPVISSWMVAPIQTLVGGTISLDVLATDGDVGDTLIYGWSANDGAPITATTPFANRFVATTTYTCPSAGTFTLTLSVTDNHTTPCSVFLSVPVICTAAAASCNLSTGVWADLSGHGHDATLRNFNFDATSGLVGDGSPANPYAMKFDGINDFAELAPGTDGLRLTTEATEEFWVNNAQAEGVGSFNIMYTNRNGPETSGFFCGILNPGNVTLSQWFAGYGINASNWAQPFLFAPGLPPSNTWTHVVATFSLTQGLARYFINGVQVDSKPMTSPIVYSAAALPRVGGEAGSGTNPGNFRGRFGEIRIWSAALDPSEVLARFQAGAPTYGITAPSPSTTVTKPVALRLDAASCH